MTALSAIYPMNLLAQATREIVAPVTPWFGADGYFQWWQVILFLVLLGLIGYFFYYRKKQQQEQ